MSSYQDRKAERQKRIEDRTDFLLREQREARAAHIKSKKKPIIVLKKDDRDPAKMRSMFWVD